MNAQTEPAKLPFSVERPTSPVEAEQFCNALTRTMDELLNLIETETELVRGGKLRDASTLQPEKARLIHEYTRGMMSAKDHAVALGNLAPAATQTLRRKHAEFQPVLRINLAVLSTAREVASDIVSTVAKAVGAQQPNRTTTYGPTGNSPTGPQTAHGIAINRSL
ncbi:flagellar protein FlgN [uncultured Roseibium sp.]|uniref:flagellar protein FlgN n=1 Tax=uncultured Roseibium sp. TaxID=1936171 RepID=UPI003216C0E4